MKHFLNKMRNTGSIISIVSLILLILSNDGMHINSNKIIITVKAICSIGVILGVLNNPVTTGIDSPFKNNNQEINKVEGA